MPGRLRLALAVGASAAVVAGAYVAGVAVAPEPVARPAGETPRQFRPATPASPVESSGPQPVGGSVSDELDDTAVTSPPTSGARQQRVRGHEQRASSTPDPAGQEPASASPEPAPAPATSEPSTEPSTEPSPEPSTEPSPEPSTEPTPEPSPEPTEEPSAEPEPTPAPTPAPTSAPTPGTAPPAPSDTTGQTQQTA